MSGPVKLAWQHALPQPQEKGQLLCLAEEE